MENPNNEDGILKNIETQISAQKEEAIRKIDAWSVQDSREADLSLKKQKIKELTDLVTMYETEKQKTESREMADRFKKSIIDEINQKIIKAKQELEELTR